MDIVIVGCGGFGREVADVIAAINARSSTGPVWNLLGYLDDAPTELNADRARRQGHQVLGPVSADTMAGRPHFVVGINSGSVRRVLAERLEASGWRPATLIDPDARIGSDCRIGEGTVLCPGAKITTNVTLGRHVQLNPNCTVGHDTVLNDYVSINPLAAVSGEIVLGEQVTVGSSAFIHQGLTVAAGTTVGASACVLRNQPEAAVLVGVPASELHSGEGC
nr:acetyltransferase [Micrococcus sp. TA1]